MAGIGKQTRGRQKIEIERFKDDDVSMITFSKRRSGIYKKASELVTMCGAEIGTVIFSPTKKPFSFRYPSIESITNRFLFRNAGPAAAEIQPMFTAHRRMRMDRKHQSFGDIMIRLEEAKDQGKALRRITRVMSEGAPTNQDLGWWEKPFNDLLLQELLGEMAKIQAFHKDLCNYLNHPVDLAALGLAGPLPRPYVSSRQANKAETRPSRSRENVQE